MNQARIILGPMRLPFLLLPPACVLLGLATAVWTGYDINIFHLIIAFIGAVAAHISVNALNEYDDFKSGLDFNTQPTPFSGGSKTLPENPRKASVAFVITVVSLITVAVIGIYFFLYWGIGILPLGILGIIVIVTYTRWLTRNPLLCLIAPGLGFGPLMVMGTDFVLTGSYSWTAFIASLIPFFLVSNLLLLNQFPDVQPDKQVGRKHIPITFGLKYSVLVYGLFLLGTYLSIIAGYLFGILPVTSFLGLLTVALAIHTVKGVWEHAESIPDLIPYMGKNVLLILATPVLTAIGLFL